MRKKIHTYKNQNDLQFKMGQVLLNVFSTF